MKDTNWHRSRRSTKECEWKQGESAKGKKKTSSEKGRGGKAVAPPVGRRSALEDGRLKIFVDTGGPLMEAATVRERWDPVSAAGVTGQSLPHHDKSIACRAKAIYSLRMVGNVPDIWSCQVR